MDNFYCDYGWNVKNYTCFALYGGEVGYETRSGVFCCFLYTSVSSPNGGIGAKCPGEIIYGTEQVTREDTIRSPVATIATENGKEISSDFLIIPTIVTL